MDFVFFCFCILHSRFDSSVHSRIPLLTNFDIIVLNMEILNILFRYGIHRCIFDSIRDLVSGSKTILYVKSFSVCCASPNQEKTEHCFENNREYRNLVEG